MNKPITEGLICDSCKRAGREGEKEEDWCKAILPPITTQWNEYTVHVGARLCMGRLTTREKFNKPKIIHAGFYLGGKFYPATEEEKKIITPDDKDFYGK